MPKYTFVCSKCGSSKQIFASPKKTAIKCSCGEEATRSLPTLTGPADVTETIDKYTGMTWKADQRQLVEQRRDEFYWTVEVPRMVNSGTYSVETMLEMGWIYIDEKNQIQINTKPPHKR